MKTGLGLLGVLALLFVFSSPCPSQTPSGSTIFQRKCAACHRDHHRTVAPTQEVLSQLSRDAILRALETGTMKSVGSSLTPTERVAVAEYLSASEPAQPKLQGGYCAIKRDPVFKDPGWNNWGDGTTNNRSVPKAVAGLDASEVPKLKLKWAFGFPGASATFGQPTVFGGRLYAGSEDGTVYSLDAKTGCIDWTFKAPTTVKTAISSGFGGRMVYFGDVSGNVYAVNSTDGKLIWRVHVDPHPTARITGSPVFFKGRLYVPVSSGEEGAAIDPKYPCCTFRGSVVALDARTGRHIWKGYTIPEAAHLTGKKNSAGTPLWGPSGAAVWSPPTIDSARRLIYVATGNGYSDPPTPYTDAVIALSMATGKIQWFRQLTPNDIWNIACVSPNKANCPKNPGHDFDFGSPPILRTMLEGRSVLIAPQKSGVVYALDPDHRGKILWESRVGKGGPLGGIEWGGAAGPKQVFIPLSDWDPNNPIAGGGFFALSLTTGKRAWYAPPAKPACAAQFGCSAAQSAPPTLIPGVVFSGSEDGHLRAYSTTNGEVIWDFNALRSFKTVDGIVANGGSMNATGPAVVNGMLYVEAGYTNNIAGNVLLAFSVDGK
ncbi:MAG: PQQ-binding-like beta-propeller repeat protein [Terriglobia bacterium]